MLGPPAHWLIEWKYDGIRAQLVKRGGAVCLWSRGEELITERFPEIARRAHALPDGTVLDGEVLVWRDGAPQPFALLQKRITRKTVTSKVLEEAPAAIDRLRPARSRTAWTSARGRSANGVRASMDLVARHDVAVSPAVEAGTWDAIAALRAGSRERGVEGLMLKHCDATYRRRPHQGRRARQLVEVEDRSVRRGRGAGVCAARPWTPREPLHRLHVRGLGPDAAGVDEAQRVVEAIAAGEAPAALQTRGLPVLVPFAKAYSGLTDEEIRQVDAQIRRTTIEKFGPVRSLVPSLVFELGFEGIQRSGRHKSGIAVRFPRMLRWRHDKPLAEADTLATLQALLGEG